MIPVKYGRRGAVQLLLGALFFTAWVLTSGSEADTVLHPIRSFGLGTLDLVSISSDGRKMATAGQSGAFLWNYAEGGMEHRLEKHQALVSIAVFSPDNKWLLTGARDAVIHCWNTETGELARSFQSHTREISGIAFAPDGRSFISSSMDGHARVWSLETGEELHDLVFPTWVTSVAFAPDGRHAAISQGATTNLTRLWNLETEVPVSSFLGHTGDVRKLAFRSEGSLVTAGDDGTVRTWNPATGEELRLMQAGAFVIGLSVSNDDSMIIASTASGQIMAWDAETGELLHQLDAGPLFGFAIVPGHNHVVVASSTSQVRVFDLDSGLLLRTMKGHTPGGVIGLDFSPDGDSLLAGGFGREIHLWDHRTGELVRTFETEGWGTMAASFSPDGSRFVTTSAANHSVLVWRTGTGEVERELKGHTTWLQNAVFSRTGKWIASSSQDLTVRVWDAATGATHWRINAHEHWVRALAFSPDDRLLVTGSEDLTARIWDLDGRSLLHTLEGHFAGVRQAAFSPDGSELMTASEEAVLRFWNPVTGEFKRQIEVPAGFLNAAVYSPDGEFILTGEGWPLYAVRLFHARTGELLRIFGGNTAPIDSVAFSPSGTMVAAGGDLLRLWDIADLAARLQIEKHQDGLLVHWRGGTLEEAASPEGPWQSLPEAASPFTATAPPPNRFFRVRVHPAP